MRGMDHFFDGDSLTDACGNCGQPYETADERHDFGKVINSSSGEIWPYTLKDYEAESQELSGRDVLAELLHRIDSSQQTLHTPTGQPVQAIEIATLQRIVQQLKGNKS